MMIEGEEVTGMMTEEAATGTIEVTGTTEETDTTGIAVAATVAATFDLAKEMNVTSGRGAGPAGTETRASSTTLFSIKSE